MIQPSHGYISLSDVSLPLSKRSFDPLMTKEKVVACVMLSGCYATVCQSLRPFSDTLSPAMSLDRLSFHDLAHNRACPYSGEGVRWKDGNICGWRSPLSRYVGTSQLDT